MNKDEYFIDFQFPDYITNGGCYAEKKNGWVHLQIYVKTATNLQESNIITTLPEGYRPKKKPGISVICGAGVRYIIGNTNTAMSKQIDTYIAIRQNGNISFGYAYADDWMSYNITYLAE